MTIIGAVSPPGGDFSEPVTENTKRFVNAFLALDKKLAYARHYPAISYLNSYSGYSKSLEDYYAQEVSEELLEVRDRMMGVLGEEDKLNQVVQLVGEDVLPDDQRITLEIAKVIKKGFLQQNAMHKEDTFVPLQKQFRMLRLIDHLSTRARDCNARGIGLSEIKNEALFEEVIKMKYTVPNNDLSKLDSLRTEIDRYYDALIVKYAQRKEGIR